MTTLLDLHHLGLRQTGNESWARSLGAALFRLDGPGAYDVAVTAEASTDDLALLPARTVVRVSSSSTRRLAWELPRALRELGSDVLLVQYTAPRSRTPTVVAVHDMSFEHAASSDWLSPATRLRYRGTIRASVRRAAHVLALSGSTRDDLVRLYGVPADRVSIVPAAVDPALRELLTSVPEDRDGPMTVLVVGNVVPRKNMVVAARAVRLMRDRGHDVRLRVVGTVTKSGRRDADEITRLLGEYVTWAGHVPVHELARAYRSAHVLAFPSLFEGFGIPALEAMAAGLPVVVSDRTSLPDVVGTSGQVVPADNVAAWAEALWRVLDGTLAETSRVAGLARSAEFSWDSSAVQVRDVFARVRTQHAVDGGTHRPRVRFLR